MGVSHTKVEAVDFIENAQLETPFPAMTGFSWFLAVLLLNLFLSMQVYTLLERSGSRFMTRNQSYQWANTFFTLNSSQVHTWNPGCLFETCKSSVSDHELLELLR